MQATRPAATSCATRSTASWTRASASVARPSQAAGCSRDGKFVVAGSASGRWRLFAVHRYTPDGGVGSSFGRDGKVFTEFGAPARADALALQANGKIVVDRKSTRLNSS